MTTYTFRDAVLASGTMRVKVYNYSQVDAGTWPDTTLDFPFQQAFQVSEEIEYRANELKLSEARFEAYDENNDISTKVLSYASSPPLNARISVQIDQGNGFEVLFFGVIDPDSVETVVKRKSVRFIAYDCLREISQIPVTDVVDYLDGDKLLARIDNGAGYSAGATSLAIDTLYKINNRPIGCVSGSIIKIGAGSTEYEVTGFTLSSVDDATITIDPGLTDAVSDNDTIKPASVIQSIGGTDYVLLLDVLKAIMRLEGGTLLNRDAGRFAFRKSGDATDYTIDDLGIFYNDFLNRDTPSSDSFESFEDTEKALGILKAICRSFLLVFRTIWNGSELQFDLRHRNNPNAAEITIPYLMEQTKGAEYQNVFNSIQISFPAGQQTYPNVTPAYIKPQSMNFLSAFSQGNAIGSVLGQTFTINEFRLVLLISGAKYEIDCGVGATGYRVLRTSGSWEGKGILSDAQLAALQDLYQTLHQSYEEEYAGLNANTPGNGDALINLRMGDKIVESSVTWHIAKFTRNPFKNEMTTKRVKL